MILFLEHDQIKLLKPLISEDKLFLLLLLLLLSFLRNVISLPPQGMGGGKCGAI
jgi:hypothetical protein